MTATYKRLGATAATGTIGTADVLYTCPAATSAVVNLDICNTGSVARAVRVAVHTATSFAAAGYRIYGLQIPPNDTARFGPYVLDATNKYLLVSADSTDVVFAADGVENT